MKPLSPTLKKTLRLLEENGPCTVRMAWKIVKQAGEDIPIATVNSRLKKLYDLSSQVIRWPGTSKKMIVYGIRGSKLPKCIDRAIQEPNQSWSNPVTFGNVEGK